MGGQAKVAVVTGASSGVGKEAAKALAAQGWRVIATGRDRARCAAAEAEIRAASPGGAVTMLRADLSLLAEARRLAEDIAALTDRVDVLINNAGGMAREQAMTAEGHEANFAGNHLGPWVLTEALLPLLRKAAQGQPAGAVRIINTSSDGSEMIPTLDLNDMESLSDWNPGKAYCSGKLANVLHARDLAGRMAADGIVAHAFHPGTIDSNFFSHVPDSTKAWTDTLEKLGSEDGADTAVWLATAEEPGRSSGGYWYQRAPRAPNPVVEDADFVARFHAATERLVAGD